MQLVFGSIHSINFFVTISSSFIHSMLMICGSGKKLLMTILKAFERWLTDSSPDTKSCLDHRIQLQAFALVVRDAVPFPHGVNVITKCYQLDKLTDPSDCIDLICQLLDKKDFSKVLHIGMQTSLFDALHIVCTAV